jgi:hypothetical protein
VSAAVHVTREQLTAALEEFRLAVRTPAGREESGAVADPDGVAEVLHATLSCLAAQFPEKFAPPRCEKCGRYPAGHRGGACIYPRQVAPYETEREARAAAHAVVAPEEGWSILRGPQNRLLLERACKAAGVGLGAYDRRILDWLSGFEDSICAVVAGLIARAHEDAAR